MRKAPLALVLAIVAAATSTHGSGYYPVVRWVIEGDTQDFASVGGSLPHPNPWDRAHQTLCGLANAKNLQGVIGTGDIIDTFGWFDRSRSPEAIAADYAYDILDACGLVAVLPAGNHDFYGRFVGDPPPPNNSDRYLGFVSARPRVSASSRSASGLSWVQPLVAHYRLLVLPYQADQVEEAWARATIAAKPNLQFFVLQHEAVDPAERPDLVAKTAAARLAAQFGPRRVPVVVGGHYKPTDKVTTFVTAAGVRALFVNFQTLDPRSGAPFWGYVVWLEYNTATGRWCLFDENVLTGERNRFEPTTCFTP